MAESRGGGEKGGKTMLSFAAKKARRVQQKMLEKVGKTEKTTDDHYTEFVVNFNKQQLAAARLQKELQKYASSFRALSANTKSFMDVWMEYYEPQWVGQAEAAEIIQNKMLLWEDLLNKINCDMIESLQLYMSKFPETKKLVEKRERKIVDYDYAKRVLEDTRQKQKNEVKVQQAEEAYQQAKIAFDDVTNSLYEELPTLYDSRIEFYSKFFSNMTSIETKFHEEMSKLDSRYNEIMGELAQEAESGKHCSKKDKLTDTDDVSSNYNPHKTSDSETGSATVDVDNVSETISSPQGEEDSVVTTPSRTSTGQESPSTLPPPSKPERTEEVNSTEDPVEDESQQEDPVPVDSQPESKVPPPKPAKLPSVSTENEEIMPTAGDDNEPSPPVERAGDEDVTETPPPSTESTAENEKPTYNVIEKRVATHPYTGEDEDELSFDKGDLILVIPFEVQDEEDEPDDGWIMGVIESSGRKGLFPENFTKLV